MPEYSKDDLRRFRENDCRIVLQNCLRHATHIVLAQPDRNTSKDDEYIRITAAELA